MTKEELMNSIESVKEEMRQMVDNAEVEKRSLTDEEKTLFEEKQRQLDGFKAELATVDVENKENKNNVRSMKKNYLNALGQHISDMVNNRDCGEYTNQTGQTINLRSDAYTQYSDVDDVQLQTFTRIIEPLQNAVIFDKLGMTFINTGSMVNLPSVSAVECTVEGEADALETQKVEYTKQQITPVRIGCAVGLGNTAVKTIENHIDLLGYALKAMREAEVRLINKMIFNPVAVTKGSITVNNPFAALLAGDASVAGKADWGNLIALQTKVKDKNAQVTERAFYVMSPATADALRSKPVALKGGNTMGKYILDEKNSINGVPVYETNAVNKYDASGNLEYSYIGFCADAETVVCQFVGATDLIIDPFTKAKNNETELVLNDNFGLKWERDCEFSALKVDSSSFVA